MQSTDTLELRVGSRLSTVLGACAIVYLIVMLLRIALNPDGFQVNFRMYYWTAMAHAQGQNPYDPVVVAQVADVPFMHPFVYPPLWLPFFRAFTLLSYAYAAALFIALKAFALVVLLALWTRAFLRERFDGFFLLLCLVGFNFALTFDLESGNMSLFAVLGLWAAFWCYRESSYGLFLALILLSASLKLTPLFFLILLLPVWRKVRWPQLILIALPFVLITAFAIARDPQLWRDYYGSLSHIPGVPSIHTDSTPNNFISILGAIQDCVAALQAKTGMHLPAITSKLLYAAFAILVMTTAAWTVTRHCDPSRAQWRQQAAVLATLCYLLLLPRVNLYEYVLLLLPACLVIKEISAIEPRLTLLLALAIAPIPIRPFVFDFLTKNIAAYYPCVLVMGLFALGIATNATKLSSHGLSSEGLSDTVPPR